MTLRAGIFGYPIGHSISPAMHRAAFGRMGFDATYDAWEVKPEDLGEAVDGLRAKDCLGANVTVPHKQAVMAHLDDIEDLARNIGAVNTIINDGGRLTGTNTDALGFVTSLRNEGGMEPGGMTALLVGAGGAARAAAYALASEGVKSLTIANRTVERAEALAGEIRGTGTDARAIGMDEEGLAEACGNAGLIVNSTSVGMLHGPAEGRSPIPAGGIAAGCVVYDMVYNPPATPLLEAAGKAGAVCVGGLPMLVYQGAESSRRWTGRQPPVDAMFGAAKEALGL